MGPLTLDQLQERLAPQNSARKLEDLAQLWDTFGLRCAFLESTGTNAFAATVVAEGGVGTLKEVGGMMNLQITPFCEVTGAGVRERPESVQLILAYEEKEYHLAWQGTLPAMLADPAFRWILQQWRASQPGSTPSRA
jgi:hypothetical protein